MLSEVMVLLKETRHRRFAVLEEPFRRLIHTLLDCGLNADGVWVSGCHPGDCHYINGNFKARRRIKLLKEILPRFGFEPERLRLTWIGASDGIAFSEIMGELVNRVRELGPTLPDLKMVI